MQLSNKGDPNNGYRYFDGSWFLCIYRCNLDVRSERRASLSLSSFSYFKVLLNYAIFKSSNLQIFKSSNLQIFKSSNLQIFKSSNLQIFKSSNPVHQTIKTFENSNLKSIFPIAYSSHVDHLHF